MAELSESGQVIAEDVARISSFLADSLEQGKDFALEQAPLVAQELIAYRTLSLWVLVIALGLVVTALLAYGIIGSIVFGRRIFNMPQADFDQMPGFVATVLGFAPAVACCIVSLIVASTALVSTIFNLMKVTVAPRVFLLDYIGGFL